MYNKRDRRWLRLIPIIFIFILIVISVIIKILLGINFSIYDIGILIFLSLVSSLLIIGLFYFNMKIAGLFLILGIIVGITYMGYVFTKPIEHKGIVGLISGLEASFIFLLVGLNIQMLNYFMNRGRIKNGRK